MKKRIISMFLALSLITVFIPAAAVHAELGFKHEMQVSLMTALGIAPLYSASYDADANVSVKDFFSCAYKVTGGDAGDISAAAKRYNLSEESSTISVASAVRIMVDISGYDKILGMYSNNYYTLAATMGMTNDIVVKQNINEPLTYDQMIMLFWNTLNMDAVIFNGNGTYSFSDKTIMEYYLKIYEGSGVLNANNIIAVDGGKKSGTGEIRIDDEYYFTGNTITEHLIGNNVKFYYYDNEREKVLKWIEPTSSKNKTATIYGADVVSADDASVVYNDGSKDRSLKLENDYQIIYNGKVVLNGEIEIKNIMSLNSVNYFIDNNNSGKYNIVIINDYEYYLVDAVSADNYIVNDYIARTTIELGGTSTDTLTVYENGIKTTPDAITAGKVIAVAKSADLSVVNVEILSGVVSGEITSLDSETIIIAGTEYDISPSYAGDELKVGKSGTFYFDKYGRVVRCSGLKESSSQYGYLLRFYRGEDDPEGDGVAEILTAQGKTEKFVVRSSLSVNDEKCEITEAFNRVEKDQLIVYKVNGEGKIVKMNTANKLYMGRDTSTKEFSVHFKGAGKYRKNNMCFNSKYLIDSTTPVFVVPYNGEKDDYTIMDPSTLVNNVTYDISVYDIDDYMYASCIVLKENFSEPENLRSKRSLIITKTAVGIDEDDERIIRIEGYQQGAKVSYSVKNTEMQDNRGRYYVKDLDEGDIVQVGIDTKGNVAAVQLLFKADEESLVIARGTDTPNKYWEGGTLVMPDLSVSVGTVTDRNVNVLIADTDGNASTVTKEPHKFAAATNVYVYEKGRISVSNKNNILTGDTVYIQEYQGNLHEVVIIR